MSNYLSKYGYVLYKEEYSIDELDKIKKELIARPLTDNKYGALNDKNFPVYIETKNKLYIPKIFGINKFGIPKMTKNYIGVNWDNPIEFKGNLFDNQKEPVLKLINECKKIGGGILSIKTGGGKCMGINTPILMYDGSIKLIQDISIGELLMGDDSTPRQVLSLARGEDYMYDVISDNGSGEYYTVNSEHILCLKVIQKPFIKKDILNYSISWFENNKYQTQKFKLYELKNAKKFLSQLNYQDNYQDIIEIPLNEYIKLSNKVKDILRGYKVKINFPKIDIDIDPYTLGLSLSKHSGDSTKVLSVPFNYKCNSYNNRIKLLAGIIDGNAILSSSGSFILKFNDVKFSQLMSDIIYLARSLGFICFQKNMDIYISGYNLYDIPSRIFRKKIKNNTLSKNNSLLYKISIKLNGKNNYYGFELNGNGRYVLGDFSVTHNTFCALKVISELQCKTLVVVNKISLMKQWENEISTFLPDATIGFIQGQKNVNISGCDIVITMLQSLSRVDYPDSLFNDFGTVVVDECFIYDTLILTSKGLLKIGELFDMMKCNLALPKVKTYNENNGKYEWKNIVNAFRKTNDTLIRVTCRYSDRYSTYYSTCNHKYLTINGWVPANELSVNDILISFNNKTQCLSKITNIQYDISNTDELNYVYDLEIKDNHNYIVCNYNDNVNYNDNYFGVVVHNCHNTSSQVFSKIFFKICSKYTIGLSATPQRSDGCENVFKWHLGDIVYQSNNESREGLQPVIKSLTINSKEYKEVKVVNKYKNEEQIQYTSMLSELLAMKKRNMLIVALIKQLVTENRKILLLSDRRSHVQELKKILDQDLSVTFTYGLFIGGMKLSELEKNKSTQCILATYKAFAEGVSEKELNTLLLVSPKKFIDNDNSNTENTKKDSGLLNQAVGRIFRKNHTEISPVIIDFQDNFSIFKNQNKQRNLFYKKHFLNGIFVDQSINLDNHSENEIDMNCIITKKTTGTTTTTTTDTILPQICLIE